MSAYENIRLPAKAVAPYRKVAQETGIPLLRLIVMAIERFDVECVAHALSKITGKDVTHHESSLSDNGPKNERGWHTG